MWAPVVGLDLRTSQSLAILMWQLLAQHGIERNPREARREDPLRATRDPTLNGLMLSAKRLIGRSTILGPNRPQFEWNSGDQGWVPVTARELYTRLACVCDDCTNTDVMYDGFHWRYLSHRMESLVPHMKERAFQPAEFTYAFQWPGLLGASMTRAKHHLRAALRTQTLAAIALCSTNAIPSVRTSLFI